MPCRCKLVGFSVVLTFVAACGGPDQTLVPVLPLEPPNASPSQPPCSTGSATGAIVFNGPVSESETARTVTIGGCNSPTGISAGFNFQNTYSMYQDEVSNGALPCAYSGPNDSARRAALFAKLIDPSYRSATIRITVDKRALGSSSKGHEWNHNWPLDTFDTHARIGSALQFPGVFPTVTETAPHVYSFTGGVAVIFDRSGQPANHLWIGCPNLDAAVLTVVP